MRPLLIGFILLLPGHLFAWSGYTHRLIAEESLKDVAKAWGLEDPLIRTPFSQFLGKFSKVIPEVKTREDFARWLKINPNSKFDQPSKTERPKLTPFEILSFYAPRADDRRDVGLHYDPQEQFWFGSGTKTGSQAFRHMEKPSFDLLHPLNTFGFPLGCIGQATERAQIYFDLALRAYQLGESYWAWNFLGVGLHYIEDLGQPYHTAQLLPPFAIQGTQAYFEWGRKENLGWISTVTRVVSNAHHYFEGYVDYLLVKENASGRLWKKALRGTETLKNFSSVQALARAIRDQSNRSAFDSVQTTFWLTGKSLLTAKIYDIGEEDEHPEDPLPYLNPDQSERSAAATQAANIVLDNFKTQGKAIRTVVKSFLKQIQEGP